MEDKFNPDSFEEFLQEQVRNQRMYPSDAVWRDINKSLHGEKRWPALTVAAIFLLSATIGICIHFTNKSNLFSIKPGLEPIHPTKEISQSGDVFNKLTSQAPFKNEKISGSPHRSENTEVNPASPEANKNIQTVNDVSLRNSTTNAEIVKNVTRTSKTTATYNTSAIAVAKLQEENSITLEASDVQNKEIKAELVSSIPTVINNTPPPSAELKALGQPTERKDYNDKNMVDGFLNDHKSDVALHTITKPNTVKNKFGYQVYISPSFSYRKLAEDRSILKDNIAGPVGLNYVTDVNKVVRHRPGTGIEAGLSIFYNLSHTVRVKSGLQFNVRQYSINAYRSYTEVASIALVGANNRVDTINTIANYRNSNGYVSTELVNRYYQLSVPIGLEWQVIGNRKVQLNVAAAIQPTYLLNRNAYLLSTNFKNYTESPEIVRRWNLNSNIEAFVSYQVGDFKWQIGPQIRYQPYSTFIAEYPIKEHLLDYGVKIGVSKIF